MEIAFNEWLPILFSLGAGLLLLAALWMKKHQPRRSRILATLVLLSSVVVGLWGTYFHLVLPLSKSRLYFLLASFGVLIATVSSVIDHVRTDFSNPWL